MVTAAASIASALPYPPVVCRDRDEWLSARRRSIGASESAAIFGMGYASQSIITIWGDKVHGIDDFEETERMAIGKLIEPGLRAVFHYATGFKCEDPGEFSIYRNPAFPFMASTLDGLVAHPEYGPISVELKNIDFFQGDEWKGDDGPLKYQIQVQHQMATLGTTHGYLFGLVGGNRPYPILVKRNDRFINETLLPTLDSFWGYVQRKELPPVDASQATGKMLDRIFQKDNGVAIMLPSESVEWDREIQEAAAAMKAAEAKKQLNENRIKAAIGEATYGDVPRGVRYSWKPEARGSRVLRRKKFRYSKT